MKKKFMTMFMVAACLLTLSACKKDDLPSKETLISRASYNGMTVYKFYYEGDDNLLAKWEHFKPDPTDNTMSTYFTFKYNANKQLEELSIFVMPGSVPGSKLFFTYNQEGKVTGFSSYDLQGPDPSTPQRNGTFTYTAAGTMGNATIKDEDGELISYFTLSYFPNGFLKERNEYEESITNQLRLKSRVIYSVPATDNIKGWEKITVLPLDSDEFTRRVRYETIQRYTYNNGVLTNHASETMSAKEYNSDGSLKRLTSTYNYILPANPESIINWEYEYVQL